MKYFFAIFLLICSFSYGQDPKRFGKEVAGIQEKYDSIWDSSKETIVFTGSSSIRYWKNLSEVFPGHQIVNSGFGGSEASDLLAFTNELILNYNPRQVFIYEGDNDIFGRKHPNEIIRDTKEIIQKIRQKDDQTNIVLIAAKPSLARWHLKRRYKKLNRKFKRLCKEDPLLAFANIWDDMLNGRKVRKDIFIEDGLHMNAKGYALWYEVIKNHIN